MSKTASYQLNSGAELGEVVAVATQNLQALGYDVASNVMNAQSASILVTKDNEGIKNLLGLGLECTVTLTRLGENQVTITIDEKWTNQIIAIAIGWFFCLVPFFTGIVGAINLNGLPQKVTNSIQSGVATANNSANQRRQNQQLDVEQ